MLDSTALDGRRKFAEDIIEQAMKTGRKMSVAAVKSILNEAIAKYALDAKHFECLDADLFDIALEAMNKINVAKDSTKAPNQDTLSVQPAGDATGDTTALAESTCYDPSITQPLPEKSASSELGESTGIAELPTFDESKKGSFQITIYHPQRQTYNLSVANDCLEWESFISQNIVDDLELDPDAAKKGTIKLAWNKLGSENQVTKQRKTRFYIIDDSKIKYDVAIGRGWDEKEVKKREREGKTNDNCDRLEDDERDDAFDQSENEMDVMQNRAQRMSLGSHSAPPIRLDQGEMIQRAAEGFARGVILGQEEAKKRTWEDFGGVYPFLPPPVAEAPHTKRRRLRAQPPMDDAG